MELPLTSLVLAANAARAAGDPSGGTAGHALEQRYRCSTWLAVYGTLAPGEPNHAQVATCRGRWQPGTVSGRRAVREYPVFTFDPAAPDVPVQVLQSADLPAHWPALDAFEGEQYRRILVPVRLATGFRVANLYESLHAVE